MPSAFWYSWSKAVSFAKETGRLVIYADEREKCRHLAQTVDKLLNVCKYRPGCPTARHTAPHKNGGEPHLTKKTKIYGIIALRTKMRQNNGGIPKW